MSFSLKENQTILVKAGGNRLQSLLVDFAQFLSKIIQALQDKIGKAGCFPDKIDILVFNFNIYRFFNTCIKFIKIHFVFSFNLFSLYLHILYLQSFASKPIVFILVKFLKPRKY